MRTPVIAGNWKMFKTREQAMEFARELKLKVGYTEGCRVVICPPYTVLAALADVFNGSRIMLGAQNMYHEKEGAFTGEISPLMIKDTGCNYVILGHSERRQFFGETDRGVNLKIRAALKHDLTPLVCVGETLEEREDGKTKTMVTNQIMGCLDGLVAGQVEKLIVAYEPVWAIGTGRTASVADAQQVSRLIRDLLEKIAGLAVAKKVCILYGGSVKPGNAADLMRQPDIDGALVGGASLQIESFTSIIRTAFAES